MPDSTYILHLSDIHLGTAEQAENYYTQLLTDLRIELKAPRLDYLVLSGDIADKSTPDEYDAAVQFVEKLLGYTGLDKSRLIAVPGNHDLNWDLAERAYSFVFRRKVPDDAGEAYLAAGDLGALKRDEKRYTCRFDHFSTHFYQKLCDANGYPREYAKQGIVYDYPDDQILFLGLNSAWEIDSLFTERAGIHRGAVDRAGQKLLEGEYAGRLKIVVCHHPVSGYETIKTDFLDRLAIHGFQICMHGHIHRGQEGFHQYDPDRGIHVVGAGTFGAPLRDQAGIPLQYNLLQVDRGSGTVTVNTRRKETPGGPWAAAAIWGPKGAPVPWYSFEIE